MTRHRFANERSLGSRKNFAFLTALQVQGSLHGELGLGELQGGSREEEHVHSRSGPGLGKRWASGRGAPQGKAPGRKNTWTSQRTWAQEEVGSRERGSTGGGSREEEHVDDLRT